ncbi:MAG: CHASE domain-containing protein [Burkholderiales bacterium]|nr:CHASE domain-containing protein [Burkholderiales bacterium]
MIKPSLPPLLSKLRIALAVAVLGIAISAWGYLSTRRQIDEVETRLAIGLDVGDAMASIRRAIQVNLFYCTSIVGLFDASNAVAPPEFERFAQHILAFDGRVSLQALEWIPAVGAADRAAFEERTRTEGQPGFRITEKDARGQPVTAAQRPVYFPVDYIQPRSGNEKAFGFDLGSNPQRLAALEAARDGAAMVATAPIRLIQERGEQRGFLIFAPIYSGAGVPADLAARRARIAGFAVGVYRVGDLIGHALAPLPVLRGFRVRVVDVTEGRDEPIYASAPAQPWAPGPWARAETIAVAGRSWRVDFDPRAAYLAAHEGSLPESILAIGLLLTAGVVLTIRHQQRRREDAEAFRAATARSLVEKQALIDRLREAQIQLLQSEKMATIGQLAAGVAHEINNPIAFVSANLRELGRYLKSLLTLADAYAEHDAELPAPARRRLADLRSSEDIEFIAEEAPGLVAQSEEGMQRVKGIVEGLKDFSRPGESGLAWTDLNQCLRRTLELAAPQIQAKAEVQADYGTLPEIECEPSALGQVFLAVLVNAAQAIDGRGTIRLRTRSEGENVVVEIEDDGCGIAAQHLSRVFDPFFTTRPPGQGTGMGLALCYAIVNRHGGRIEAHSTEGRGTTLRISLPANRQGQPAPAAAAATAPA